VHDAAVVEKALDYALNGPLNSTEFMRIPYGIAGQPGRRERVVTWVIQHYAALQARMPSHALAGLITIAEGGEPTPFERLREFLLDPVRRDAAAEPNITKATERMAQRALLKEKESANVKRFLASWSARPASDR
jgi:hypothetical protein